MASNQRAMASNLSSFLLLVTSSLLFSIPFMVFVHLQDTPRAQVSKANDSLFVARGQSGRSAVCDDTSDPFDVTLTRKTKSRYVTMSKVPTPVRLSNRMLNTHLGTKDHKMWNSKRI